MPVQIVISHVCSSWRYVALGTGELWANVYIRDPFRNQQIYNAWLTRAGQHPISLRLNLDSDDISVKPPPSISSTFWKFVKHFPIRHLGLIMYAEDFCDLWASGRESQDTSPYLERLDIRLFLSDPSLSLISIMSFNIPAAVIGKTRSATFSAYGPYVGKIECLTRQLAFPWAQLRDLAIHACTLLSWCMIILQQMPLLEQCSLNVAVDEAAENTGHLTLSHLQSLILNLTQSGDHIDAVIRHFTCPNLTLLDIEETLDWSTATWDMIRKQYNLHHLQGLSLNRFKPLSNLVLSSVIFRDAPMLRNLNVGHVAIMDEETCAGMVTGAFGRFLRSLTVLCKQSDLGVVLRMAKDRQLAVAERLKPGCSWQDEMASLKQLNLRYLAGTESPDTCEDEMIELERLGVAVTVSQIEEFDFD
ncbi:hypothetical protein M378DRAFT_160881 [Amanita muscaria Koide BX008]|uniref:F-box domain-containing protein n=1 Tax=Amanita muscaria (strain Koide BX008) TaxID=946122 RepID=A0A0C2XAS5_AMAMK|nr:hypothetical protein M378DRAFT_160881 [Amanita muscaria Koide BX008]